MHLIPVVVAAVLAINLWTIRVWRHDKQCAIAGTRRTPESELLLLAALGGTPAAFFARRHFRHKTLKQPFSTWLMLIAVAQAGAVIGFAIPR